jgi:hypothetical protein
MILMPKEDIDWNEVWKSKMSRHIEFSGGQDCSGYFEDEEEARNYWRQSNKDDGHLDCLNRSLGISPGFRILDIGAGPGSLALPWSRVASHITAIEPSHAMMSIYPNVVPFLWDLTLSFSCFEEAVTFWSQRMHVSSDSHRSVIREHLRRIIGSDQPVIREVSRNMLIWRDTDSSSAFGNCDHSKEVTSARRF